MQKYFEILNKKPRITRGDLKADSNDSKAQSIAASNIEKESKKQKKTPKNTPSSSDNLNALLNQGIPIAKLKDPSENSEKKLSSEDPLAKEAGSALQKEKGKSQPQSETKPPKKKRGKRSKEEKEAMEQQQKLLLENNVKQEIVEEKKKRRKRKRKFGKPSKKTHEKEPQEHIEEVKKSPKETPSKVKDKIPKIQEKKIRKRRKKIQEPPEETIKKEESKENAPSIPQEKPLEEKISTDPKFSVPKIEKIEENLQKSPTNPYPIEQVKLQEDPVLSLSKIPEKIEKMEVEEPLKSPKIQTEPSSVFEDLELPIFSNFLENEEVEKINPKAMHMLAASELHGRLVKIIKEDHGKVVSTTKYIKKKQKNQKSLIFFSDNSCLNLEEEMVLILQEPCFAEIASEEKFKKIFDKKALEHFQENFENMASFFSSSPNKKVILWPVFLLQKFSEKDPNEILLKNRAEISDDLYLNLESSNIKVEETSIFSVINMLIMKLF